MNRVRLKDLARDQDGVVAVWQLVAGGWPRNVASRALTRWQRLEDGVYLVSLARPNAAQRRRAAALTTPDTALSHRSAAVWVELLTRDGPLIEVTRPGRWDPHDVGGVRVRYSTALDGWTIIWDGVRITKPERIVIDLWPRLPLTHRTKLLREGLRKGLVTMPSMRWAIFHHRGRRGVASLRTTVERYARLQLDRCRSDAEAYAMEVLDDAGFVLPRVNTDIAGEEADLSWEDLRLIIELDGPGYHVLRDADAHKTAVWTHAGYRVRRLGTDPLFENPGALITLAEENGVPRRR